MIFLFLGLMIGIYFGGYFKEYYYLGFLPSDISTLIFSAFIVYFTWVQSNFIKSQYGLSIENSKPSIIAEVDGNDSEYLYLKNMGENSAYDIKYSITNIKNADEDEDIIDIMYAKSSKRIYLSSEWLKEDNVEIFIQVTFKCSSDDEGEVRNFEDEIHLKNRRSQDSISHWNAVV
jgi:hypothetical protein